MREREREKKREKERERELLGLELMIQMMQHIKYKSLYIIIDPNNDRGAISDPN